MKCNGYIRCQRKTIFIIRVLRGSRRSTGMVVWNARFFDCNIQLAETEPVRAETRNITRPGRTAYCCDDLDTSQGTRNARFSALARLGRSAALRDDF
ncbi:MAG: hypothetical protein [Cressdnaviricota sp.]|nr:MAG: hypothetical protein [Cressdnaviricota sp.]